MTAVTFCSDFGAQENEVCHCFHCFPSICHEVMRLDAIIFVFWMLSFKPPFHSPSSRGSFRACGHNRVIQAWLTGICPDEQSHSGGRAPSPQIVMKIQWEHRRVRGWKERHDAKYYRQLANSPQPPCSSLPTHGSQTHAFLVLPWWSLPKRWLALLNIK